MDLRGQVGIVTGASRGLGRHIALRLGSRGVRVAVTGRTEADLERVAAEIREAGGEAIAVALDVARWTSVEHGVSIRAPWPGHEAARAFGASGTPSSMYSR